MVVETHHYPLDAYGNTSLLVAARMDDAKAVIKMIRNDWEAHVVNVSGSAASSSSSSSGGGGNRGGGSSSPVGLPVFTLSFLKILLLLLLR